jgi:putative ABC transport system permease protein
MSVYLAFKEIWRNRGRYFLFSLVIALITTLVLFIAALAGGLATSNRQFIEKLDADLLIFQENVDLQTTSSRLDPAKLRQIRRVEGIAGAGPIGLSTGSLVFPDGRPPVDIALVGVEPGQPGYPPLLDGAGLRSAQDNQALIDDLLAAQSGLRPGDRILIRTIQGTDEETFALTVAGITDERRYFFQPAVILPLDTWEQIRPQASRQSAASQAVFNMIAIQLERPEAASETAQRIASQVDGIEIAGKQAAILAIPGYTAQQSTLNTQQVFTLLIGVLVVGGFFQIQTLQKVAQIGVLKAIGNSNRVVALAALFQIIIVTVTGVLLGSLGTLALTLAMPAGIPVLFTGSTVAIAVAALLLIGPLGGLVSIRLALRIDPLTAIGLSS